MANYGNLIISEAQNIFTIGHLKKTDSLFLWVSLLCVPNDSVFKETVLKRPQCLTLSQPPDMIVLVVRRVLVAILTRLFTICGSCFCVGTNPLHKREILTFSETEELGATHFAILPLC